MTVAEREAFLADVQVNMDGTSKEARLLRAAGPASLVAQSEEPPSRDVSVDGPVTVGPPGFDILQMSTRYLGLELGAWYAGENQPTEDSVVAGISPEHRNTMDDPKLLG